MQKNHLEAVAQLFDSASDGEDNDYWASQFKDHIAVAMRTHSGKLRAAGSSLEKRLETVRARLELHDIVALRLEARAEIVDRELAAAMRELRETNAPLIQDALTAAASDSRGKRPTSPRFQGGSSECGSSVAGGSTAVPRSPRSQAPKSPRSQTSGFDASKPMPEMRFSLEKVEPPRPASVRAATPTRSTTPTRRYGDPTPAPGTPGSRPTPSKASAAAGPTKDSAQRKRESEWKAKLAKAAFGPAGVNPFHLYDLFHRRDPSNDGRLDVAEFISMVRRDAKIGSGDVPDVYLQELFDEADRVGHDGETGTIDYKDFLTWLNVSDDSTDTGSVGGESMLSQISSLPSRIPSSKGGGGSYSQAHQARRQNASEEQQRPDGATIPQKGAHKITKELTLPQLHEMISAVYESKQKHNKRCVEAGEPIDTLEHHLFGFLCKRYSDKQTAAEWTKAIYKGIQLFAKRDASVAVFGKILQNRLPEGYKETQDELCKTIGHVLRKQLQKRYSNSQGEAEATWRSWHHQGVPLQECESVVCYMYQRDDSDQILPVLRERAARLCADSVGNPNVQLRILENLLIDFQADSVECYLEEFTTIFRELDADDDSVLSGQQLEILSSALSSIDNLDACSDGARAALETAQRTLQSVLPRYDKASFSECVENLFADMIKANTRVRCELLEVNEEIDVEARETEEGEHPRPPAATEHVVEGDEEAGEHDEEADDTVDA